MTMTWRCGPALPPASPLAGRLYSVCFPEIRGSWPARFHADPKWTYCFDFYEGNNEAGLQRERSRALPLRNQIAVQVASGYPNLQPLVDRLDTMLGRINQKLAGTRSGGSGPDDYFRQIEDVRDEFNRFNREAPEPLDFAHRAQLDNYDPYDRR
ncbi:hypothetical protein [Xanthomonas graminis]|uniref:hypothetical protein n=1 Tax=Xanthomonas graminis TaxID=3390026 RepID=UPI001187373E|nr:hypothetical protein [Xanthomonas translucens]UKE76529.1 hypothetical protein KM317_13750 [Xanthomonas translucens pv. arrhenatheri]